MIGKYEQHLQFWKLSKIGGAVFLTEFLNYIYAFLGDDGLYYLRKLLVLRLCFFTLLPAC